MENFFVTVLTFLSDLKYLGIALGLMIEVIPSEIVLSFGGYLVSQGKITFVGAVVAGTIGGVFAQLFLYWAGYYGGRPFLNRFGKYIFIQQKHLDVAEQWFNQYGTVVIFTARFIPVVRHAISIPAGIAKMSVWRFTTYTTLAVIPWSILFIFLGTKIGENWVHIKEVSSQYMTDFIIGALVIIAVFILISYIKKKRRK
jgi:membrane protein DedA with SNARE-associated domain